VVDRWVKIAMLVDRVVDRLTNPTLLLSCFLDSRPFGQSGDWLLLLLSALSLAGRPMSLVGFLGRPGGRPRPDPGPWLSRDLWLCLPTSR